MKLKLSILLLLPIILITACKDEDPFVPEPMEEDEEMEQIYINEFLASNDLCCSDNFGEFDDWIEIYNNTSNSVDLGGMYLTDTLDIEAYYKIPTTNPDSTTIAPGEYLVLWADKDLEQGILHIDFKLSATGELIRLVDKDGITLLDSYTYSNQEKNISTGRDQNNDITKWISFDTPTPGQANN